MSHFQFRKWPIEYTQDSDFAIPGIDSCLLAFSTPDRNQTWESLVSKSSSSRPLQRGGQNLASKTGSETEEIDYDTCLKRWYTVLESLQLTRNGDSNMSQAQFNAYALLYDWWHNAAFDSQVTSSVRDWIEKAARLHVRMTIRPRIGGSRYNLILFDLWRSEFMNWQHQESGSILYSYRSMAAAEAACHKMTENSSSVLSRSTLPAREHQPFSTTQLPKLKKTHQVVRHRPMTASIEPCSWISSHESRLPFYLWDKTENRTVTTEGLQSPDYAAISHTWGRWRLQPAVDAHVEGVPWPIPENSLFQVRNLPWLMTQVPTHTRYIWFDLLCIPQNMSDPHFGPRAQIEIANQAEIFRLADIAIAWFNWIPHWSGLRSAVEWLVLLYTCCDNTSTYRSDAAFEEATVAASETTHLLSYPPGVEARIENLEKSQPSSWFTSLWTLQEVCLRPEMILCARGWQPLQLGHGYRVSLDHLIALWINTYDSVMRERPNIFTSGYDSALGERKKWPIGVTEIALLLESTGMRELPRMSPQTVMILGNQRYCESRRAEAIMSVLDARDWFSECKTSERDADVLGKYPLAFVQELRKKLGGKFFATADTFFTEVNSMGTLLPFSDKSTAHRRVMTNPFGTEDHPAVETWEICSNGQVLLPEVGIVAAYPSRSDKREIARVICPSGMPGVPENRGEEVDLSPFLASFAAHQHKYAVCLLLSSTRVNGLILAEEGRPDDFLGPDTTARFFRKIGAFFYNANGEIHHALRRGEDYTFPESEKVDWIVL